MVFVIAFGLILFLVLWLRRPDSLLNAQFWAEDATVFFRDQVEIGFWKSVFHPYSGYLHVVPRILVVPAAAVPVRWAPFCLTFTTLLLEALCCSAFFWPCYRRIIASGALRAACCLLAASCISTGAELIGTACNLQWFLCILSLLLILLPQQRETKKSTEGLLTLVQALIAVSAPTTILYAPFLARQCKTNIGWRKIRPAVQLLLQAVQLCVIRLYLAGPRPNLRFNTFFLGTLSSGVTRCVLSPMIGSSFLTEDQAVPFWTKLMLALMLSVALTTALLFKLRGTGRLQWLLGAAYIGIGSLLLVLFRNAVVRDFLSLDGIRHYTADRYFFVGACMFIFCVAIAIDTFTYRFNPSIGAGLLLGAFAMGVFNNYQSISFLDLHWQDNAASIENWEAARRHHEKAGVISVPVNPAPWQMKLESNP